MSRTSPVEVDIGLVSIKTPALTMCALSGATSLQSASGGALGVSTNWHEANQSYDTRTVLAFLPNHLDGTRECRRVREHAARRGR
jgi:hypothetical protein